MTQSRKVTQILFVQVAEDNAEKSNDFINEVVDIIHSNSGTILHVISSIIIACFDSKSPSEAGRLCSSASGAVRDRLRQNAKSLYGECRAIYGNFGSPTRMYHGPFIPGISDLIEELRELDFGSSRLIACQ